MTHAAGPVVPAPNRESQSRRATRRNAAFFIRCVRTCPWLGSCARSTARAAGSRGLVAAAGPRGIKAHPHRGGGNGVHQPLRQRRSKLGVQQRAGAEREAEQQSLDGVVTGVGNGIQADAQRRDSVPGRTLGS